MKTNHFLKDKITSLPATSKPGTTLAELEALRLVALRDDKAWKRADAKYLREPLNANLEVEEKALDKATVSLETFRAAYLGEDYRDLSAYPKEPECQQAGDAGDWSEHVPTTDH